MNLNKELWKKRFQRIADTMRKAVRHGRQWRNTNVLDQSCGDYTTAIPAAKTWS